MAWNGLDGVDDFFVGYVFGSPGETGVASVHQEDAIAFGIAPQGSDKLATLFFVQWSEVHDAFPPVLRAKNRPFQQCRFQ